MPELVDELLVEHYDPAYLRSIDRNFVQYRAGARCWSWTISRRMISAAARMLQLIARQRD